MNKFFIGETFIYGVLIVLILNIVIIAYISKVKRVKQKVNNLKIGNINFKKMFQEISKREEIINNEYKILEQKKMEADKLIEQYMTLISNHKNGFQLSKREYKILMKRVHPDTAKNDEERDILTKISAEFNERK